jgi:hypothetical protein
MYRNRRNFSSSFLNINTIDKRIDNHRNLPVAQPQSQPSTPRPQLTIEGPPPLRSRIRRDGIDVSVYATIGDSRIPIGSAVSTKTLLALVELGYMEAETVEITGTVNGERVSTTIHEHEYETFQAAIAI